MNKSELIEKVAQKTNLSRANSELVLDATLEIIQATIAKGGEVKLVGFGSFLRAKRQARPGRNPKTGDAIVIPESRVPKFKPGKEFKDLVR